VAGDGGIDSASAPLLGHVVADRYFVESRLGEGGMGTVYTARHVTLDKKVALKVLHGEFSRKQELVDRFLQEAKAASSIRNEHVIDITDFGVTSEGFVFFTMEYLQGKDLHTLLKEVMDQGGLLPWQRSKNIFLQVCAALTAAHAQGVIHRDLKPENIFLVDGTGRDDYVKLLDFGIAKVESPRGAEENERKLTKTGMLFGTPEYMAPEQARGEKPDHRVDVYAMGCLLFQFLVGTVPFKAESFMAILTQHMVEPVPEISPQLLGRSGAPAGILAVVNKALAKDRDERYATIEELAQGVREATGVSPSEESAVPRERRPTTGSGSMAWTGSVRGIDTLVEEEVEQEQLLAAEEAKKRGGQKVILGALAAVILAGGGFAASRLMATDDAKAPTPALTEEATPTVDTAVEPSAAPATDEASTGEGEAAASADPPAVEEAPDEAPVADTAPAADIKATAEADSPPKEKRPVPPKGKHWKGKVGPKTPDESKGRAEVKMPSELADEKKPKDDKPERDTGDPLDAPTIKRPEGF
jgi:serine/threonine-protein kinase